MSTKQALKFRYSALDASGKAVAGVETASSSGAAHLALVQRGYQPLEVSEKRSLMKLEVTKKKVPRKEIMHFSRQMGVFMKAGIPIMEALEVIEVETTEKLMKKVIVDMIDDLRSGDTFAAAARSHPEAFPNFYVGILESAELTGNLDTVLNQLADYIERDVEARSTLTSAMIYPAVVGAMSIGVVLVLAVFVMPRFVVFFNQLHAKLPLPTRMLMSGSSFFSHWWYALISLIVIFVVGVVLMRRSPKGKTILDGIILRLPVLGLLVQAAVLERICRVLSSMLRAGVDLPQAMAVTADSANNSVYRQGLGVIREQMMQGQGLATPLAETGLFPGAAKQMFRVGEETGTLDTQLETAAAYYHRELEVRVKHFTSLFEPAIIIFMGVVVGFVAVALISAMYGIYSQVKVG
jgi:type IV pilus assembly protein PilC